MVATGKKRTARYLQGDRFRGPLGEGTLTLVRKKGLFPYEITWWNGRSEIYSAEQIERYGYQYLPPDSGVEDIEEEEVGLFDGDFSRESEKSITPELTWKDWVKGDRVCSEKNGKHGVVEKLKFRPQSVFILWDDTADPVEYSPADLELLEISLGLASTSASTSEDFSREQQWEVGDRCTLIPDNSRSAAEQWQPGELIVVEVNGQNIKVQSVENPDIQSVIFSKFLQPCSDNSTSAQVLASDFPSQDSKSEGLPLSCCAKSTTIAEIFSFSDTQEYQSPATLSGKTGNTSEEQSTLLQLPLLANLSQSKGSDLPPTTQETVSQPSSKRSPKSNRRTSRSKTSRACSVALTDPDTKSDTLAESSPTFPSAGTMSSGSWSAQEHLERPSLESGCSWLEGPTGLSSTGRAPGLNRLETLLVRKNALQTGEVINPAFLEDAFEIPRGWTDPLELRAATELLEAEGQRSETVLTPELPPSPSVESSTLTESPQVEGIRSLLKSTHIDWDNQSAENQSLLMKLLSVRSLEKISGRLHVLESVNKVLPEASRCAYSPIQEERMWDIPHFKQVVKNIKTKVEPNEAPWEILEYYRSCWKRFEKWEKAANKPKTPTTPILESPPLPSGECSTLTESLKTEEELTPVDDPSVIGRHYWCDRHTVTVTIETLHNWRETPRSPEIIRAARCRPWWHHDRWGNKFPSIMVLRLDELVEIEELSCPLPDRALDAQVRSLEKFQIPVRPITGISQDSHPTTERVDSLEKPETQPTTKQIGSLYQYTANKSDKLGNISTYPKVEGDRLREEDAHWYWGFSYVEKQNGKWRDKSAAVPRKKLPEVKAALREGKNYTYILQQVLGKD